MDGSRSMRRSSTFVLIRRSIPVRPTRDVLKYTDQCRIRHIYGGYETLTRHVFDRPVCSTGRMRDEFSKVVIY